MISLLYNMWCDSTFFNCAVFFYHICIDSQNEVKKYTANYFFSSYVLFFYMAVCDATFSWTRSNIFYGQVCLLFRKSVIVNGEIIFFFFKNRYPDRNMIIAVLRIYLRMFAKDLKTVLNLGKCCLKMYHKPVQIFSVRYKVCSLDIRLLMCLSQ